MGNFRGHSHGVKGEVFIKNRQTLVVKNFEYDGQGPDAFFWVGTSTQVGEVGWVLPYPFQGRFYEYQDENVPILKGKFDGQKDLE